MEENTNINVVVETKENYPQLSKYAKAKLNVLDEVPQSYSHQKNPKLEQTRYTIKTHDHEYVDLKIVKLFSWFMHSMKKDMQSWIVLLCLFTSKQVLLDMWSYRMW